MLRVTRITEAEQEQIGLLSEEMGEVTQACGKILRHGINSHHPSSGMSNREDLTAEAGDAIAAIEILIEAGTLTREMVEDAVDAKLEKLLDYLHKRENKAAVRRLIRKRAKR
jgi:NTP pyrophosphatase (non-canonical NTP hydrolase)